MSGIYKIEDVQTGNVYVGSANKKNGIAKRWSNHLSKLRAGKHRYAELQDAFNDGANRVKFEILEQCPDDELEERENYWIAYCKRVDDWTVINKRTTAKRGNGVKDTSNMSKAQSGSNNGNARLKNADTANIKYMLKYTDISKKALSEFYGVSVGYISNLGSNIKCPKIAPVKDYECELWNDYEEKDNGRYEAKTI